MKLVGYTRVSKEEQKLGYSLDAQRLAIQQFCQKHGHDLVAQLSDEGRTARTDSLARRPQFRTAIEMVKARQVEAIVIHKPDRAARNLRVLLDVLFQLGGGLVAVEGDFDYSTPEGKLRAHILGSVAQWYSDNLSREAKKGLDERKRQGLWNGRLPVGYRKDDGDKNRPPVPDTAPCLEAEGRSWSKADAVRLIFEETANGETTFNLVKRLRALGFDMARSSVDHILHNRFYLGELPLDSYRIMRAQTRWTPGKHAPLISRDMFDRALAVRRQNNQGVKCIRSAAKVYPLSGLVRCARCQGPMHIRTDVTTKTTWLFCYNRYHRGTCDQRSAKAEMLEQQVLANIEAYAPAAELLERGADLLQTKGREQKKDRDAIVRRRRRLLDLYEWGQITREEYTSKVSDIDSELAALTRSQEPYNLKELKRFLADLPALYRAAGAEDRNALTREIFDGFLLDDFNITAVQPRPIISAALQQGISDLSNSPTKDGQVVGWGRDRNPSLDDVSIFPGTTGQVVCRPLTDGWWTSVTAFGPVPPYKRGGPFHIPREWWPRLAEEYAAGVTQTQLATRWGCTRHTIGRTLKKHQRSLEVGQA